jgi:hypothetical protein
MDKFREALEHCELHDLGFEGDAFTWRNNSHDGSKFIKERLDHAVATEAWCAIFPGARVINDDHRHSDHRSIILEFEEIGIWAREGVARGPYDLKQLGWKK